MSYNNGFKIILLGLMYSVNLVELQWHLSCKLENCFNIFDFKHYPDFRINGNQQYRLTEHVCKQSNGFDMLLEFVWGALGNIFCVLGCQNCDFEEVIVVIIS